MRVVRTNSSVYPSIDDRQLVEFVQGRARLEWGNKEIPLRLNGAELEEFFKAKRRGFCVGSASRENLLSAWGFWCELRHRPTVKVGLKRKYARVTLDMITSSRQLCGHQQIRILQAASLAPIDAHCEPGWLWGGEYFDVDGLLPDRARALAAEIWRIATTPCRSCIEERRDE